MQWVGSIDLSENTEADVNILVGRDDSLEQQVIFKSIFYINNVLNFTQEKKVLETISVALDGSKLDAVICVAGGWAGGNAKKGQFVIRK